MTMTHMLKMTRLCLVVFQFLNTTHQLWWHYDNVSDQHMLISEMRFDYFHKASISGRWVFWWDSRIQMMGVSVRLVGAHHYAHKPLPQACMHAPGADCWAVLPTAGLHTGSSQFNHLSPENICLLKRIFYNRGEIKFLFMRRGSFIQSGSVLFL